MIMNMSFYFNFKVYDRLQPLGITILLFFIIIQDL